MALLRGEVWKQAETLEPVITLDELREMCQAAEKIFVHDAIYEYIVSLVEATRTHELFAMGASPRACIALLRMARAMALLAGRDFVTVQDVQVVLLDVLRHRVKLGARARAEGKNMRACIQELFQTVKSPRC